MNSTDYGLASYLVRPDCRDVCGGLTVSPSALGQ